MSEYEHIFGTCITSHSWNGDRSLLAICPNDSTVRIVKAGTWEEVDVLQQHDQVVTGIDWAPNTNKIATSSQDRNAYVWEVDEETGKFKPMLVLLRLTRAATCVKWSPEENKFAIGSGEKLVCICTYNQDFGDGGSWVAKQLKGKSSQIRSTVLSVEWHPNNCFLIIGGVDQKARVYNCFNKDVDGKAPRGTDVYGVEPADRKLKFGTLIAEYGASASWIHAAKFNPSGTGLAYIGHDSSVHFAGVQSEATEHSALPHKDHQEQTIKTKGLPFKDFAFIDDTNLVAVGHDAVAEYFVFEGGAWVSKGGVDKPSWISGVAKKKGPSAMAMFQNKSAFGGDGVVAGSKMKSLHQNAISGVELMDGERFSTCGFDGRIVVWDSACLASAAPH